MTVHLNRSLHYTPFRRKGLESSIPSIVTVVSVPATIGVAALVINIISQGAFFALIGATFPPVALIIGALVLLLILAIVISHLVKQEEPEVRDYNIGHREPFDKEKFDAKVNAIEAEIQGNVQGLRQEIEDLKNKKRAPE